MYETVRNIAPDNVIIVPAYNPKEQTFPTFQSLGSLLTGSNISYGVHGYWHQDKWVGRDSYDLYGWVAFYAPVIMTEVYGYCGGDSWPSAPDDFTNMLDYNRSNNIGVTNWVFDHLSDEIDAVITALGSPNDYTDPWTWEVTSCTTSIPDTNNPPHYITGPGDRYSNWMLGH